ncbi:cysteine hydrolase family protein [Rhodococcus qingshengii]|uniref:cysteine hydrolase family protein n=1 Tax=Rhodococcus qingshengii TaxID=334542 RepID=UPI001ADF2E1A|nr:cysteine hydrolase family protein [Rhodococcus qingshengii]
MNAIQRPALIVIDVQRGFDNSAYWGPRNNPKCENNIAELLAFWRLNTWPVVFVRHDSTNPQSTLAVGTPGNEFKDVITGEPDLLVRKIVNSSFHGSPDLNTWLSGEGIKQVVICGITTNHCCETTARVAGNLGYDTYFVIDATHTFDRPTPDGSVFPAETVAAMTAANLHGEFATVVSTHNLLGARKP